MSKHFLEIVIEKSFGEENKLRQLLSKVQRMKNSSRDGSSNMRRGIKAKSKWIHVPFEFVAASAIFWNASKYVEIAWIAALKRKKMPKHVIMRNIYYNE